MYWCSSSPERATDQFYEIQMVQIALSAFIISLKTGEGIERIVVCIDRILSREWVHSKNKSSILSSIYTIGIDLLNTEQVDLASVFLEQWFKASLDLDLLSCKKVVEKSVGVQDVLRGPFQNKCIDLTNINLEDNTLKFYTLLSKSTATFSNTAIGIAFEQELLAYEEIEKKKVDLFQRMQLNLIGVLLRYVYDENGYSLEKSRILVKKGRLRLYRARGINGLNECVQSLSEAISTFDILHDIREAIKLWKVWSSDVQNKSVTGNVVPLLCCIADLLSIKGYFNIQYDIIKLIIIFLKKKDVSLEKGLAMLWADRRLTHSLCISPMHEDFISNSQDFGTDSDSNSKRSGGFGRRSVGRHSCTKDSRPLQIGFRQKFSLYNTTLPQVHQQKSHLGSDVTVDEVKEVVSNLLKALSIVKEALRFRLRLLKTRFIYNCQRRPIKSSLTGETIQQPECDLMHIELGNAKREIEDIFESIGNSAEAEGLLVDGKSLSCLEGLPIFGVAFHFCFSGSNILCQGCKWSLEVTVDKLGLALRSRETTRTYSDSLNLYKSAIEKLKHLGWANSLIVANQLETGGFEDMQPKEPRKLKKSSKQLQWDQCLKQENTRMTRSKSRLSDNMGMQVQGEPESGDIKHDGFVCLASHSRRGPSLELNRSFIAQLSCDGSCFCNNTNCWRCHLMKVMETGTLKDFIKMKWEINRWRLLLRLVIDTGKCTGFSAEIPETHVLFWESISLLVSRLLATIFLLPIVGGPSLSIFSEKVPSTIHWASFFHQASLGISFNSKILSNPRGPLRACNSMDYEDPHVNGSTNSTPRSCNLFRLAPEKRDDLEEFVMDFFEHLQSTTVVCISLLSDDYYSLLRGILCIPSPFSAWMLLSRLNFNPRPIAMLIPTNSILEDDDADSKTEFINKGSTSGRNWRCPWGYTLVDDLVPQLKTILTESHLSTNSPDLPENKGLCKIEATWLGPWKCMLLGEPLDCNHLDSVVSKLMSDMNYKSEFDAKENLLRVILGDTGSVSELQACVSQLYLNNGNLAKGGCILKETPCGFSSKVCEVDNLSELRRELILEASRKLENIRIRREPIIMVLDSEVQNKFGGVVATTLPSINLLDAFYLLNPSGDLKSTQDEFEKWFRDHNFMKFSGLNNISGLLLIQGRAGEAPTTEELVSALKDHDLFMYFGHGNGML
ncbi:hypothetical protein GIB67_036139 [Kingdonia uniflora]|uniref:separase n=1 Tax=Kingdonia uniflora TaxID=39325 RepID=A0A7J7N8X1_9MAGN|nr:hypothetical protein GIB67_036139 [Kingdonia uniflora]